MFYYFLALGNACCYVGISFGCIPSGQDAKHGAHMQSATPKPTRRLQHFAVRATNQYGEFETGNHCLVEARDQKKACEIVEAVIEADNLENNGHDGSGFSWFAHADTGTAVHEDYDLKPITAEQATFCREVLWLATLTRHEKAAALRAIRKAEKAEAAA